MLTDSGLAMDPPMTLPDGTEAKITVHEEEKRHIINFDEADQARREDKDQSDRETCKGG